jgi:GH15 family glucan-1,4-alpha-glucosidase
VRDSAFALDALLALGSHAEVHSFFWWLLHAAARTHPRLRVVYRLDGGSRLDEREVPFEGYCGSAPVRIGNAAARQLQLGIYGDLLETAWLYTREGYPLDGETARRIAEVADLVCDIWRCPDSGIWETRSPPRHFTHSKLMCWTALEHAQALAARGVIPGKTASRWRLESGAIRQFIDGACWSSARNSYLRSAGSDDLDAAILRIGVAGYLQPEDPRLHGTIDAVRRELADGVLVHRYVSGDGVAGAEGAFVACSFWLVQALAHAGRVDEAVSAMEELLALANDVGLYAEEIDPETDAFLGNFPQGLSHLALLSAADAIAKAQG